MTPAPGRQELVAYARDSIARGSKSFALASRLFDRKTRENVWLLYAWCRRCDDIADGQEGGGTLTATADAPARLAFLREQTARAFTGAPVDDPAFACLGLVAHETGLTPAMAEAVIEGFALDAADWTPRSEAELMRYCWHVAGAVGVMMAVVMGVRPDEEAVLDRACDLGLAFQLANIARDLMEDDAGARCYLPAQWLADADIPPGEQLRPCYRDRLVPLARRLCDLSEAYEASARFGAFALPPRARWAVLAVAGSDGAIARLVRAREGAAWDRRAVTTTASKLAHVARSCFARRPADPGREGLWTRPRES